MKITCRQTHSVFESIVMPEEVSVHGEMFSGLVLHHMNTTGSASVARATGSSAKTLTLTDCQLYAPVEANANYRIEAYITGAGEDYLESFVRFYVCDRFFKRQYMAASAFFTYEPVDPAGGEVEMPQIIPETEAEKQLFYSFDERDPKNVAMKRYICKLYPTDCSL